jgi:hypothetical protein
MVRGSFLLALALGTGLSADAALARLADRPLPGIDTLLIPVARNNEEPASAAPELLAKDTLAPVAVEPPVLETKTSMTLGPQHDGQVSADRELARLELRRPREVPAVAVEPTASTIHTDYQKAMQEAHESRKMLFVYFYDTNMTAARRAFETLTLPALEIQEKLKRYVYLELPRGARIASGGKQVELLKHAAFAEMLGRPGLAVIDLVHERAEYYGRVVSTFPFSPGRYYSKSATSVILDLPPGTLTQRTMIYAVRIHPEGPASTQGQFHRTLAAEAQSHADYQASIQVQGHHSWDARFHRINAKLPSNVLAQEVVAESWPNESLVEACVECVDSWRQSPGHWSAVRSRHPLFGYDIKRGRNGIWYATGIFGRRNW